MNKIFNILLFFLLVITFSFGGYYFGAKERYMEIIVKGEPVQTIVVEAATTSSVATADSETPSSTPNPAADIETPAITPPSKPKPKPIVKKTAPVVDPTPAPAEEIPAPAPAPAPEPTTHVS